MGRDGLRPGNSQCNGRVWCQWSRAGLSKSVTVHTLRHSFATHLLEQGVDIRVIQDLPGHRHIKSTVGYARVAINLIRQVQSPLEFLNMARTAPD